VRPTLVKKGATFGANATTVCGTTWGPYSFSGAGAVITRNVLDQALVLGNSAKQMGWMCECGERLADDLECTVCNKIYKKTTEGIEANDHQ
jgi:UDP-2-acetamido-3-amino-2,3-dideoxy-glucuronate N-acetyltransferase